MASNIPVIVQGNSFSLAIPLQIYYINGGQMDLEDYTPDPTDEVSVQLKGSRRNYTYTPTIDGNVANIDLSGNELADNYSVGVSIVKANGQRLRSFRTDQFFIVESSDDLTPDDIIEGLEENVIYLNSSIFVAGEDGRGIESIVKTSTSGLVDTYTITYTDATTSTFNVTNGAQGEAGATIASVEKTATVGKVDTYTITMTDGYTFDFEVTNGLDGVDLGLANIVNDLTTGGATNVLSAEQGKILGEFMNNPLVPKQADLTQFSTKTAYINTNNTWSTSGSTGKFIPIPTNAKKIHLKANANGGVIALLKNDTYSNGASVEYATGCARTPATSNQELDITNIPSDAHYLWVSVYTTGDRTPQSVAFYFDALSTANIVNDLATGGATNVLSAEQGKVLNEKIEKYRYSAKRTMTATKTSQDANSQKRVAYPLYEGGLVHIKVTLSSSLTGTTYIYGKVDETQTNQRILLRITTGTTSAEADIEVDRLYNFMGVWNANSANLTSITITFEITHKVLMTGYDKIANNIQVVPTDSTGNWWRSSIRIPVKKGNILWASGYGFATAYIASVRYGGYFDTATRVIFNDGTYVADVNEGFITFTDDGYVSVQSLHSNITPKFVLYADRELNEEIVISASNTPTGIADQADYHCSGTNDEVLLNDLFACAVNLGRKVKLLRGDYYVDTLTKKYEATNDTFLLVDTSPLTENGSSRSFILNGESPAERPKIHISDTAYEGLNSNTQYHLWGIYDSTTYGGYVEIKNLRLYYPSNQKKIVALNFEKYGGYARLHSISALAYTNGYNGQQITISNPPAVAVDGCAGLRFIGKGPNGAYGSEITDSGFSGFYEGVAINTEWAICTHVYSIFCVYGWVFGKYGKNQGVTSSATHPNLLLNCGDERNVNLPKFYANSGLQDIEMYAFSIERSAPNTPGGVLGTLATEQTQGSFRGVINYNTGLGSGNSVNVGFWEYGHGHGMRTTDTSHLQAGTTATRNTYRPNYMQRYFDTTVNKLVICVDEENNTWKDTMGNTI